MKKKNKKLKISQSNLEAKLKARLYLSRLAKNCKNDYDAKVVMNAIAQLAFGSYKRYGPIKHEDQIIIDIACFDDK